MFIFYHIEEIVKTFCTPSIYMHSLARVSFPILSQYKKAILGAVLLLSAYGIE